MGDVIDFPPGRASGQAVTPSSFPVAWEEGYSRGYVDGRADGTRHDVPYAFARGVHEGIERARRAQWQSWAEGVALGALLGWLLASA